MGAPPRRPVSSSHHGSCGSSRSTTAIAESREAKTSAPLTRIYHPRRLRNPEPHRQRKKTVRVRLSNRSDGVCPPSKAEISGSLTPTARAIAMCWTQTWVPLQRWATRRMTSSRNLASSSVSIRSARTNRRADAPITGACASMRQEFVCGKFSRKPLRRINSVSCWSGVGKSSHDFCPLLFTDLADWVSLRISVREYRAETPAAPRSMTYCHKMCIPNSSMTRS